MRMRLLRAGDVHGAARQLYRWNRADGKVMPGLAVRAGCRTGFVFALIK